MQIQIDKNIPIPPAGRRTEGMTATFRMMEIGDSFYSESSTASFHMLAKRAGVAICVRKEKLGHRVWRIK